MFRQIVPTIFRFLRSRKRFSSSESNKSSNTRSTFQGIESLEERLALSTVPGTWLSAIEIRQLPTSGPAWESLASAASASTAVPNIQDQDEQTDVVTLAKAIVGVRTDNSKYLSQVRTNVLGAIGSEVGGRTLALGRNLASYVIAAELAGLDPAQEAQFKGWLQHVLSTELDGKTLQSTHEVRPNNWGTMAGASRAAIAAYLGDEAELARIAKVFKGWLGDVQSYSGFEYGDLSWQADSARPVGVNPKGATKDGHKIDGAIPDDMRRGGDYAWPPLSTGYPWEAIQGVVVQAEILSRAGYDAWNWQDQAILRSVEFLYEIGWPAAGDDEWIPWLIDARYGTHLASNARALPGKVMGWTAWTHQFAASPVSSTNNLAPVVDAGPAANILLTQSHNLDGTAVDDGFPVSPGTVTTIWTKLSGPGTVTFADSTAVDTQVTFSSPGVYVLQLQASDGSLISRDRVTITVIDPVQNQAPVVNAGADQVVLLTALASLDGTVTDDGRPSSPGTTKAVWSKVSGPGRVRFADPLAVDTTARFSTPGTYVLQLAGSDGVLTTTDSVTITVNAVNQAPIVFAGPDESTTLLVGISLAGIVTDDDLPESATITTSWTQVSGPGTATFEHPDRVDTSVSFSVAGTYVLRLQASDGELTADDSVTINAGASSENSAPLVDAGPDATVYAYYREKTNNLDEGDTKNPDEPRDDDGDGNKKDRRSKPSKKPPSDKDILKALLKEYRKERHFVGATVAIHGTVTDVDSVFGIQSEWSKVNGPGPVEFTDPHQPDTNVIFQKPGTYVLRLTATDGLLTGSDDLVITVLAPNLIPVVSAGKNQQVAFGQLATLQGTVTDDGMPAPPGDVQTLWSVVSGPGVVTFTDRTAANTTASFTQPGTYKLRLTADDGERIGFQELVVSVKKPKKTK